MNQPKSSYSSVRTNKRFKRNKDYGQTLFKTLFIIVLSLGVLTCIASLFLDEYFTLYLTIGVNSILFSFLFKFMESVITLLREIKDK